MTDNTNKTNQQHVITEQVSITPLDNRLYSCEASDATLQLEIYHTDQSPARNVGVINKYNKWKKYSYAIGDAVSVLPRVDLSFGCWLTNVVMNNFLRDYLQHKI